MPIITDNRGGYLWPASEPASRYQGWFLRFHDKMYKIVDDLEVVGGKTSDYRKSQDVAADLRIRPYCLLYRLNKPRFINVYLDVRESYLTPKWGRHYKIKQERDKIIVHYHQSRNITEPKDTEPRTRASTVQGEHHRTVPQCSASSVPQGSVVIVFKFPSEPFYIPICKWVQKEYPFDKARHSPPYQLYIYKAFRVKAKQMLISAGRTKQEALVNADNQGVDNTDSQGRDNADSRRLPQIRNNDNDNDTISSHSERSEESRPLSVNKTGILRRLTAPQDDIDDSLDFLHKSQRKSASTTRNNSTLHPRKSASIYARQSLVSLLVYDNEKVKGQLSKVRGLYGGLPWFFQFWTRDELISLKGLLSVDSKAAFDIFQKNLSLIGKDGRLPTIRNYDDDDHDKDRKDVGADLCVRPQPVPACSADAVGWLFLRAKQLLSSDRPDFPVAEKLEKAISGLLNHHTDSDGLAVNNPHETWMDSIERTGARVEVQALRLNMYHLAYEVTYKKKYKDLEKNLKAKLRDYFWTGEYLKDGKHDACVRPNLFLAYYIYPQLLDPKEWKKCFNYALDHLWCDWIISEPSVSDQRECSSVSHQCPKGGGVATVDKDHPKFCDVHTGQDPKSYHNGDSWFWINNLAAIAMHRLDSDYYKPYIEKILRASTQDILSGPVYGCPSELSSASTFSPAGSPLQAWSAATYIELMETLNLH